MYGGSGAGGEGRGESDGERNEGARIENGGEWRLSPASTGYGLAETIQRPSSFSLHHLKVLQSDESSWCQEAEGGIPVLSAAMMTPFQNLWQPHQQQSAKSSL